MRDSPGIFQVGVGQWRHARYVGGKVDLVQLQIPMLVVRVTGTRERRGRCGEG